ncbi:DHH family phosphoesterase [Lactococcus allomyrinae]|uniref:Bifunctional oligoribonuclease/PAP phosphatase NrnA n=1 Tax=Lactococcus allomyrinae TaxID=2419773 RepID=A0A387BN13_9LACT|nr:bifunctional oligoribonuclease/PAP phosphatase NrnA [Lactococcus allomyrinae]AYF99910.1 bifunctional oligoribonuclease/PAP phosphatase NrnA [Lactococcus allomyrinae]
MKEILDKIKEYNTILIHRHKNPDPDAIGSQAGLRAILRENFPKKKIYAVGYDEPTLTYLAEMDTVTLEENEKYLSIVCDTANTPRIDDDRWKTADFLIKIDHHPNDDAYGNLLLVEPERSSASEIIADFAFENKLSMNAEAARLLYGGIVGDTGRFLYPATSPNTLKVASMLAEYDFDRAALGREMSSFDMKVARLQGFVYENMELSENGAARVLLTQELLKKFALRDAETSSIVSVPGNIRGIESWAIFVEQADGHFRVRMRSKVIPINEIAKAHDGGGHPLASGANSYSLEENEKIWQELQDNLKK